MVRKEYKRRGEHFQREKLNYAIADGGVGRVEQGNDREWRIKDDFQLKEISERVGRRGGRD